MGIAVWNAALFVVKVKISVDALPVNGALPVPIEKVMGTPV